MKIITLKQLELLEACPQQRKKFKKYFGRSVEISEKLCLRFGDEFDFNWIARKTLSKKNLNKYRHNVEYYRNKYSHTRSGSKREEIARRRYERSQPRNFAKLFLSQKKNLLENLEKNK
jgi:hypothetical protein